MKKIKLAMMGVIAFLIFFGIGGIKTYAKVNSILIKDTASQKVYEYNYADLSTAFETSMLGTIDPLYNDYLEKMQKFSVYGIYDDTKKYVDFAKIQQAFSDAQIDEKPFNINDFTSSADAPLLTNMPTTLLEVSVNSSGEIITTEKAVNGTNTDSSDFSVISIE